MQDGTLMRGEVLARWQDFAGAGDLLRTLQSRGAGAGRTSTAARRGPRR